MEIFAFRLRRFLAAALGIGFALQPVLSSAAFSDVSSSSYKTAISALEARGVLKGYEDGTYKPNATINRAEFLKIILQGRGEISSYSGANCFDDVHNEWFAKYVCSAKTEGIIAGYPEGDFRPNQPVNFVEAAKIISLAYKQEAQSGGSQWYEPYARALDASKAIPVSIAGLDRPITRGEMAEMMWRLSENKTDQPAKGYLNVKYPKMQVNLASDNVQTAKSCADLQALAQETQSNRGTQYGRGGDVMLQDAAEGAPAPMANQKAALPTTGGGSDGDYSKTNVQVEGVDEADIVKTDGDYVYLLKEQSVRIVKASPASALTETSIIELSKENMNPTDLYIDGTTLAVMGQLWQQVPYPTAVPMPLMERKMMAPGYYPPYYSKPRSVVRLYDISDKANPKLAREITFDGTTVSSRKIGDKMYLVLQQPMMWAYPLTKAANEAELMPNFKDSAVSAKDQAVTRCGNVVILPHPVAPEYITVATIPLKGKTQEVKREVVVGSAQNIYASLDNLYVAMTEWKYDWDSRGSQSTENTHVYRFAFTDDGVDYAAQGSVPGRILNQFSMDEHESVFRIATTVGQTWDEDHLSKNALYVLNKDMQTVGTLTDMAPGEQIYSVRFMGDRAYVVTFKTVDPLFVIDTSDARNPKILGSLKIPGYSDYLHPYDETHLIGFGKEVDESIDSDKVHTPGAIYYTAIQGMKVALFDVADPAHPKEISKVTIGDRGTESPLLSNHKALLFDKERGLIGFPVTVYKQDSSQPAEGTDMVYPSVVFQGAYLYSVSLKDGLKLKGTITHYGADAFAKSGNYWYGGGRDVSRVLRIGESLFTISNAAVQANGLTTLDKQGSVELKQTTTTEDKIY
jgi:inhibitor of cysteine peptidase